MQYLAVSEHRMVIIMALIATCVLMVIIMALIATCVLLFILMTLIASSSKVCSLQGLPCLAGREEGDEEGAAALAPGLSWAA